VGPVFSGTWNFERSHGIWPFPRNVVLAGDKGTNTAYFGRVHTAIYDAMKYTWNAMKY